MSGLKNFFATRRPTDLTVDVLEVEIRRIEAEAERLEQNHWRSDPHLEAAKLLRADAAALKTCMGRVIAGHAPILQFQKGEEYRKGDIALHAGAIWQKTLSRAPFLEPGQCDDWIVVSGTPTPKAAPLPAVLDSSLDLTKDMPNKTAEERKDLKFAQAVERRVKQIIEENNFSESGLKRPISLRYFLVMKASLTEALLEGFDIRDEKIDDLERRLEELEAGGIKYRGSYQRACAYKKGDTITHAGSMWVALKAVPEGIAPGSSHDHWQLAVKNGETQP